MLYLHIRGIIHRQNKTRCSKFGFLGITGTTRGLHEWIRPVELILFFYILFTGKKRNHFTCAMSVICYEVLPFLLHTTTLHVRTIESHRILTSEGILTQAWPDLKPGINYPAQFSLSACASRFGSKLDYRASTLVFRVPRTHKDTGV